MQRSNEITARPTGISIYRVIVPILVVSTMLVVGTCFFSISSIFPTPTQERVAQPDQRQAGADLSRSPIDPIFGQHYIYLTTTSSLIRPGPVRQSRHSILFRSGNLPVDTDGVRHAQHVGGTRLGLHPGLLTSSRPAAIVDYRTFDAAIFRGDDCTEPPAYFKKEVRQSSEYHQDLRRDIRDLQHRSHVVRLRVHVCRKNLPSPSIR